MAKLLYSSVVRCFETVRLLPVAWYRERSMQSSGSHGCDGCGVGDFSIGGFVRLRVMGGCSWRCLVLEICLGVS